MRVDPATGDVTEIGLLNNAASGGTRWVSSGDVVSIKGGGTYLTVRPETGRRRGGDRIVEVDPKTGALLRIIGPTGSDDVLGLGYWGGIAYGFTLAGTSSRSISPPAPAPTSPSRTPTPTWLPRRRHHDRGADHRRVITLRGTTEPRISGKRAPRDRCRRR